MLDVWILAAIAAAVSSAVTAARMRRSLRRRLRSGSLRISDGALVTVIGTVRPGTQLVEAPLSGRHGVITLARFTLEAEGRAKFDTAAMATFELDTTQGTVIVDAPIADLLLKPAAIPTRDAQREAAYLVAHGRGPEIAPAGSFSELVVRPGDRITVHGLARIEQQLEAERGYREAPPTRTRIIAPPAYRVLIGPPLTP